MAFLLKCLDPTIQQYTLLWGNSLLSHFNPGVKKKKKPSIGSPLIVLSPQHLTELLSYKGSQTLPPSHIFPLQISLIEDLTLTFKTCPPLSHFTLLSPPNDFNLHQPLHSSYSPIPPIFRKNPCQLPHTLGLWMGVPFLMITTALEVIECNSLPPSTTNQQANLIAPTQAFTQAES